MSRPHKYKAVATVVDGLRFASKAEARRYSELRMLERSGRISDMKTQPAFPIVIEGRPVRIRSEGFPNGRAVKYLADFSYLDAGGAMVVEDVKGMDTDVSRLKRALVEAIHGVRVTIIG